MSLGAVVPGSDRTMTFRASCCSSLGLRVVRDDARDGWDASYAVFAAESVASADKTREVYHLCVDEALDVCAKILVRSFRQDEEKNGENILLNHPTYSRCSFQSI